MNISDWVEHSVQDCTIVGERIVAPFPMISSHSTNLIVFLKINFCLLMCRLNFTNLSPFPPNGISKTSI